MAPLFTSTQRQSFGGPFDVAADPLQSVVPKRLEEPLDGFLALSAVPIILFAASYQIPRVAYEGFNARDKVGSQVVEPVPADRGSAVHLLLHVPHVRRTQIDALLVYPLTRARLRNLLDHARELTNDACVGVNELHA